MSDAWRDTVVVVPFRLGSQRFPNKALARFRGRPLLEIAIEHALALGGRTVVVTAPAADLAEAARTIDLDRPGVRRVPSAESCGSATERVVEIFAGLEGSRFATLPIDEPALDPAEVRAAAADDAVFDGAGALTFHCPFFAPEDYLSPLSAKVVVDARGRLLYMSRAVIPVTKAGPPDPRLLKKNVGAFVFQRRFLEALAAAADTPTALDRSESLEQLRWLELGLVVRCVPVRHLGFGIDVPEQLAALEARIR